MHYLGIIHTGGNTYWELNKYQKLEKISNIYVEFLQILTVLNLAFNKHNDNLNILIFAWKQKIVKITNFFINWIQNFHVRSRLVETLAYIIDSDNDLHSETTLLKHLCM